MNELFQVPQLLHVVISMTVGGAEKLVYDMVRNEAFSEKKPVICCLNEPGELGEKLLGQNFKVYFKNRKSGIDFSVVFWLRKIMKMEKIEVVHAHQYSPLFYTVLAASLTSGVRVVYTEHGRFFPERKSWKRTLVNPILALGIDHLVSISHATADAMATYDNLPRQRINVIHNGMDCSGVAPLSDPLAKRKELGLSSSCKVIGTAARLNSIKNIHMMIRGLKLVLKRNPDTCLVIAGQGEEGEPLKVLASKLGVADHVKFIGLRFDLHEIYQLFDVFLLTSFSEGISVTLLEAMSHGVPSVVTAVGGNCEVVEDGVTGYLVPVDDDQQFACQIISILTSPSLAQVMGAAARKRAVNCFSIQKMMAEYLKLYQ